MSIRERLSSRSHPLTLPQGSSLPPVTLRKTSMPTQPICPTTCCSRSVQRPTKPRRNRPTHYGIFGPNAESLAKHRHLTQNGRNRDSECNRCFQQLWNIAEIRSNYSTKQSMGQPAGKYGRLLSDLHSHLSQYGERHWAPILQQWIADLEQLERVQTPISGYAAHLSRTKDSFGGMGSLNDVAIAPQVGYKI